MKSEIITRLLTNKNGNVSVLSLLDNNGELSKLVIKDGLITAEPHIKGESVGALFDIPKELRSLLLESLSKLTTTPIN